MLRANPLRSRAAVITYWVDHGTRRATGGPACSRVAIGQKAFTMSQKERRNLPGQDLHLVHDGAGVLTVAPVVAKPGVMLEDVPSF